MLDEARHLMDVHPELSAHGAVHAAVAVARSLDAICSFDRHFDRVQRIERREP